MYFIPLLRNQVERLLLGSLCAAPEINGQTLQEELLDSGMYHSQTHSHFATRFFRLTIVATGFVFSYGEMSLDVGLSNAQMKLYGGPQYERMLKDFERAIQLLEFPRVSQHELASCSTISTRRCRSAVVPTVEAIVRSSEHRYKIFSYNSIFCMFSIL